MQNTIKNPFIVGDWIKRDEDFIGREELINKYLLLEKQNYWLIGARRMGKTSLLRYLQRQYQKKNGVLPLYWDVSGANTAYDLKLSFIDSLEAGEENLLKNHIDLEIEELEDEPLINIFRLLIRKSQKRLVKVVLLIDESEALFQVAANDEAILNRLKAVLFNTPNIFIVIASNHGLSPYDALDITHISAPFLQHFLPPDYLKPWSRDEAISLIQRYRDEKTIHEEIISQTGCLPFLVQMVCFYSFNLGNVQGAIEKIINENILDIFIRDDFNYFTKSDTQILIKISQNEPVTDICLNEQLNGDTNHIEKQLTNLSHLGFLRLTSKGEYKISNQFLNDWIQFHFANESATKKLIYTHHSKQEVIYRLTLKFHKKEIEFSLFINEDKADVFILPFLADSYLIDDSRLNLTSIKRSGQKLFFDIFGADGVKEIYHRFSQGERRQLIIQEKNHQNLIPFELMHDGFQFLVLKHEVFRTLKKKKSNFHLKDISKQTINILLIASDTPPSIPLVDNEIIQLKKQFQKISRELYPDFQVSTLLSHEANLHKVENLLRFGDFHFVHYAGHLGFDPDTSESLLYFWDKSSKKGPVRTLTVEKFTQMVRKKLALLYINGCNSADYKQNLQSVGFSSFVDMFHKNGTSTFIGNNARVDDRLAAEFALEFYWNLFSDGLEVSRAFFNTRVQMAQRTMNQENGHIFWLYPSLWTHC